MNLSNLKPAEGSTKNRKLYNGRIKTYFYLYFGEKPPKQKRDFESQEIES